MKPLRGCSKSGTTDGARAALGVSVASRAASLLASADFLSDAPEGSSLRSISMKLTSLARSLKMVKDSTGGSSASPMRTLPKPSSCGSSLSAAAGAAGGSQINRTACACCGVTASVRCANAMCPMGTCGRSPAATAAAAGSSPPPLPPPPLPPPPRLSSARLSSVAATCARMTTEPRGGSSTSSPSTSSLAATAVGTPIASAGATPSSERSTAWPVSAAAPSHGWRKCAWCEPPSRGGTGLQKRRSGSSSSECEWSTIRTGAAWLTARVPSKRASAAPPSPLRPAAATVAASAKAASTR